ncbi:MAG TPA: hypothetical protein VIU82_10235 [Bosea sp. (in: a-proteobacteria)]
MRVLTCEFRPASGELPSHFQRELHRLRGGVIVPRPHHVAFGGSMEQILMNLVAGAIGGNAAGKASPTFDLGTLGNTISGLVGGGVLGQLIPLVLPAISAAAQGGNLSIGGIMTHLIAGGAGGAILTAIIGALKNKAA